MTRTRSIPLAALAAVALVALVVAGCGGNDDNGNAHASSTPPKTKNGGSATVGVASSSLGNILVDSQVRTIYRFQKDTGSTSTCSGACAAVRREAAGHPQRPPAVPLPGRQQRR